MPKRNRHRPASDRVAQARPAEAPLRTQSESFSGRPERLKTWLFAFGAVFAAGVAFYSKVADKVDRSELAEITKELHEVRTTANQVSKEVAIATDHIQRQDSELKAATDHIQRQDSELKEVQGSLRAGAVQTGRAMPKR
jgi:septal ring factor EnvC (AmiA/AmiB activator)